MGNQEGKIELRKKVHRRICVRDITFLTARPPFYVIFCCFLCLLLHLPKERACWMAPIKLHNIAMVGVLCDDTMSERSKYDNLLQFNASWLASLETWYYFQLCFSFSCSGYDLILIKKTHAINCYSFLQKFLLKTKTYKLVGNCGSSIYC